MARKKTATGARKDTTVAAGPRCGLCGKTRNLIQTDCCGQWICDDESTYVMFSYARNSCSRNHRRYTLCGFHHTEGHSGSWQECTDCREEFETEIYVYYGTNDYNFTKLENPPSYEPTRCSGCGRVISLAGDGYSVQGRRYLCDTCTSKELERALRRDPV